MMKAPLAKYLPSYGCVFIWLQIGAKALLVAGICSLPTSALSSHPTSGAKAKLQLNLSVTATFVDIRTRRLNCYLTCLSYK